MAVTLQDRYRSQFQALLPPGLALQAQAGSDLYELANRIAKYFADVHTRADIILSELDPRNANNLLPTWENSLALPDSCTVGEQTILARRQAVVAKLTDSGGARLTRYILLAKSLGYSNVTITRHKYHNCEMDCEQPVNDAFWRSVWTMNLASGTRIIEGTCESTCEEPLRTWGDTTLECMITKASPAMSSVLFNYGSA